MLLINSQQLDVGAAKDENHPQHQAAKEYVAGIKILKKTYGRSIKFVRPGFPHRTKGIDGRGNEVPNVAEPSSPMMLPLSARFVTKDGNEQIWDYVEGAPTLLPNNLWAPTGKRSEFIEEFISIDLNRNPDLAFFFYYKSPASRNGGIILKIDDPEAAAKIEGDKKREELDLNTALYSTLSDEARLRVVAQAYGIAGADKKHPDALRKKLLEVVLKGNERKRSDPTAKGVAEFLTEMKVTDSVRLRSLLQIAEDAKKITWLPDGKYKVGEREICRVPRAEHEHKRDYMCNHLLNAANLPKLQDLLLDIVDKEYLDGLSDDKTFTWLARVMDLEYNFKKPDVVRENVYEKFVVPTE